MCQCSKNIRGKQCVSSLEKQHCTHQFAPTKTQEAPIVKEISVHQNAMKQHVAFSIKGHSSWSAIDIAQLYKIYLRQVHTWGFGELFCEKQGITNWRWMFTSKVDRQMIDWWAWASKVVFLYYTLRLCILISVREVNYHKRESLS